MTRQEFLALQLAAHEAYELSERILRLVFASLSPCNAHAGKAVRMSAVGDWIAGLLIILSPFIAGYFSRKQIRDLDAYINRDTKTIDKH